MVDLYTLHGCFSRIWGPITSAQLLKGSRCAKRNLADENKAANRFLSRIRIDIACHILHDRKLNSLRRIFQSNERQLREPMSVGAGREVILYAKDMWRVIEP